MLFVDAFNIWVEFCSGVVCEPLSEIELSFVWFVAAAEIAPTFYGNAIVSNNSKIDRNFLLTIPPPIQYPNKTDM